MSRIILLAPLCVLLLAGPALGVVGPIPTAGWGYDCSNWIVYSDPWVSGPLCYDPNHSGGDGWMVCGGVEPVDWPPLDIEMWIEMECTLWWDETRVQIHRYADYSDVVLYFHGGSCCNNGQWIITTPPTALGTLDYLPFVDDVLGRGPTFGTNIPLTWDVNILDGAGYVAMVDGTAGAKQFVVPLSCQDYVIRVTGDIAFHQEDGYYYLGGEGCYICPANPM